MSGKGSVSLGVVVVGAGVSGCTCAATMAAEGVRVTVLSSALDAVGLPAFGPDLCAGVGCVERLCSILDELPPVVKQAWVDACVVPEDGPACVAMDRRRLSVELKRALEGIPGLEFRQGVVVDVRGMSAAGGPVRAESGTGGGADPVGASRLAIETAFGEVIEADAVVLAPGLGLGGTVSVGEQVLRGGRYGEIESDGLRRALEALGAEWGVASYSVGSRYGRGSLVDSSEGSEGRAGPGLDGRFQRGMVRRGIPLGELVGGEASRLHGGRGEGCDASGDGGARWGADHPPSPYFRDTEESTPFVVSRGQTSERGEESVVAYPDGQATGEVYVPAGSDAGIGIGRQGPSSRLEHVVKGSVVLNAGPDGRFVSGMALGGGVFVAGRAAGARDYLESLESGIRVGRAVVDSAAGWSGAARPLLPDEPDTRGEG